MATTLIDEVVRVIRASVGADFGDGNTDATCKVYSDFAPPRDYPYAVVYELAESYDFMTRPTDGPRAYIANGTLQIDVYDGDRGGAKDLGVSVIAAISDNESSFDPDDGPVMALMPMGARFTPYTQPGPDGPAQGFVRSLTFSYQQQRSL